MPEQLHGHIHGARGQVQDETAWLGAGRLGQPVAPVDVLAPGQGVVEEVVPPGDAAEHVRHPFAVLGVGEGTGVGRAFRTGHYSASSSTASRDPSPAVTPEMVRMMSL